jgi:hypothetical protein
LSIRDGLKADLLAFIDEGGSHSFDELAWRVARYQAGALGEYGRLVQATVGEIHRWEQAPLVPTEVFRECDLSPTKVPAQAVFLTSGTTAANARGVRRVPDLELYERGCVQPFVEAVLGSDVEKRPWLSLIPGPEEFPDSSLSHMVGILAPQLASETTYGASATGIDVPKVLECLQRYEREGRPVLLLTTAFALLGLLEAMGESFRLPLETRMMLTGGFKGKSREVAEHELLRLTEGRLGLAPSCVVGEYGMTELTSQAYGSPLRGPPWLKIRTVDPLTLKDCPAGVLGLVAFFDLLNLDNVSAILTSDLGILDGEGALTLHGRAPGSRLRGCSLRAEEWLSP